MLIDILNEVFPHNVETNYFSSKFVGMTITKTLGILHTNTNFMYTFRPAITRSTMKIKVGGIMTKKEYI